jgi:hypothetical protein
LNPDGRQRVARRRRAGIPVAVPQALELIAERRFDGSHDVLLQYACAGSL